jgi:hypothetical protein
MKVEKRTRIGNFVMEYDKMLSQNINMRWLQRERSCKGGGGGGFGCYITYICVAHQECVMLYSSYNAAECTGCPTF